MKRIIIVSILALALAGLAFAAPLAGVEAKDARSMGLGGSFTALATGFDTFYGNPAALSSGKGQLMLADLSTWLYFKPTEANIAALQDIAKNPEDTGSLTQTLNDFVSSNGFGGGFTTGFGYAGHGFGLGVYALGDVLATGQDAMTARLKSVVSLNAVVGIGIPIQLGPLTLSVGGDLRPFFRAEDDGTWLMGTILSAAMNQGSDPSALETAVMGFPVDAGFGFAADLGLQVKLGGLYLGAAVRDVGPEFKMYETTLGGLKTDSGTLSENASTAVTLDPSLAMAFAFRPAFLKGFLEPGVYAEFKAPFSEFSSIGSEAGQTSVWNYVHLGADLKFLSMITARAGLNQGYVCAGVGLNLFLVEVDAAVFTQELGLYPGELGRSGVTVQASIHL